MTFHIHRREKRVCAGVRRYRPIVASDGCARLSPRAPVERADPGLPALESRAITRSVLIRIVRPARPACVPDPSARAQTLLIKQSDSTTHDPSIRVPFARCCCCFFLVSSSPPPSPLIIGNGPAASGERKENRRSKRDGLLLPSRDKRKTRCRTLERALGGTGGKFVRSRVGGGGIGMETG